MVMSQGSSRVVILAASRGINNPNSSILLMKLKQILTFVGAVMLAAIMSSCGTRPNQSTGITVHGANYGSIGVGQQQETRHKSSGHSSQRSSTVALASSGSSGPAVRSGAAVRSSHRSYFNPNASGEGTYRVSGGTVTRRQVGSKVDVVWDGELVDIDPLAKARGRGVVRHWDGMPEGKGRLISHKGKTPEEILDEVEIFP